MDGVGAGDPRAWRVEGGETLVLRGRARPWVWVLLGCAAFTVAGVAMIVGPLSDLPFGSSRRDSLFTVIMGAVAVLFFGVAGGGAALHGLIHHRRALVIDRAGLRNQGGQLVPWYEVHGVLLVPAGREQQLQVMLRLGPAGERAWLTGVAPVARWLQRLNRAGMPVPTLADGDPHALWELLGHLSLRLGRDARHGWR
ncbi:hypothetical protein [Agrococcus beijingensis]|uniref:hypothetical protein n=1 Tax=Agrococcus beijingensis TaxID=3068634 RepID=UPI002741908D|nr:hypothetical protein [Agrococcus sp. REN33]